MPTITTPRHPGDTRHGFAWFPKSRAYRCREEHMGGDIQYEPQSVEAVEGFPTGGPPDGQLASGGHAAFAALDGVRDPKGRIWGADPVTPGRVLQWHWWLTAPHSTRLFEYFITRDGWDQTRPLERASFEPEPFLRVLWGAEKPAQSVTHWGQLPDGKRGRHVVYAVWEVADTDKSFYQAVDVDFGG